MAVESDSQPLLTSVLEQLNTICIRCVKAQQIDCARVVIDVYSRLFEEASEMAFVGVEHENPVLDQLHGYFGITVRATLRQKTLRSRFGLSLRWNRLDRAPSPRAGR